MPSIEKGVTTTPLGPERCTDAVPARVRTGSFEDFVHDTGTRLLRTAVLLCGDRDRAQDLVQSAYAAAFSRWRLVARADHPLAYTRTILVRLHLSELRRRRVVELPLETDAESPPDPTPLRLSLLAALDDLAPVDRAVVVLRFWEDLDVRRTAELLGLTESACRTRSSRALARLRTLHPTLADPEDA